jgi:hypothetical protein
MPPFRYPTSRRSMLMISSYLFLGLPSGLPSGFPTKALYAPPFSYIRATCPVHLGFLDLVTRIIFGEEYKAPCYVLLHSSVTSFLSGPNIFLSTLFSKTLSLHSPHSVSGKVSQPYKTTGKINQRFTARICCMCGTVLCC